MCIQCVYLYIYLRQSILYSRELIISMLSCSNFIIQIQSYGVRFRKRIAAYTSYAFFLLVLLLLLLFSQLGSSGTVTTDPSQQVYVIETYD